MSNFHTLKVATVTRETPDSISIGFEIPVHLEQTFRYTPGQYLTLQVEVNGEKIRRAYSLCTSPHADRIPAVTVKRVEGGKMSNYLNDKIQPGSLVEVMAPQGRFMVEVNPQARKHYILLGGGSGITPLFAILKSVLLKEPDSKISLIYGNRNVASIIFREGLRDWASQYAGRLDLNFYVDASEQDWTGGVGVLDASVTASLIKQSLLLHGPAEFYLCGPAGFMEQAKAAFTHLAVPAEQIHIEYFSAPVSDDDNTSNDPAPAEATMEDGARVTVILDGTAHELVIKDHSTILQASIKAGIDPPFSCEAGICSTCLAKVLEGKVKMDENNILTEDEVAKGFVLTCQAHPITPVVKLEYFE